MSWQINVGKQTVGTADMPLAPIESDVTAHLQLFLPAVHFTGERLWFGGQ